MNEQESPLEAVGKNYDANQMMVVREKTREAVNAIAAAIKPGMIEDETVEMAKDLLSELGLLRGWHDVCIRFGENTAAMTSAPANLKMVLGEDDIFLVDIGPCWKHWEGDGGDTFVTGSNAELARCAADVKNVFHEVRHHWLSTQASGKELYDFAKDCAARRGWELSMDLSGHRIADFPHKVISNIPLSDVGFHPSKELWVLEIYICDKERRFGAFFEDMLLDDSHFEL